MTTNSLQLQPLRIEIPRPRLSYPSQSLVRDSTLTLYSDRELTEQIESIPDVDAWKKEHDSIQKSLVLIEHPEIRDSMSFAEHERIRQKFTQVFRILLIAHEQGWFKTKKSSSAPSQVHDISSNSQIGV